VSEGLRERVRSGEPSLGVFLSLGSPLAAEACALAGFAWVVVDLEHGGGGEEALLGQIHAADAHGVPVLVRVESAERIRAGRVLDLGAAGVMFPRLEAVDEVAAAVRHLRYPPAGDRGVATYNRALGFGLRRELLDTADERVLGVVQIESVPALERVDEIARVPGVDVLFVGPLDLTNALGVRGRTDAPEFRQATRAVVAAARAAGIAPGILAADAESARGWVAEGFTFVAVASDAILLATAARGAASALAHG